MRSRRARAWEPMGVAREGEVEPSSATSTRGARAKVAARKPHPSHQSLDRLVHDRTRLAILSALAATESLAFGDLKAITEATDGNLSVHARKLEEAGYVSCQKSFAGRTPRTDYRLTAAGRRAFEKYLDHMDAVIRAARRRS